MSTVHLGCANNQARILVLTKVELAFMLELKLKLGLTHTQVGLFTPLSN